MFKSDILQVQPIQELDNVGLKRKIFRYYKCSYFTFDYIMVRFLHRHCLGMSRNNTAKKDCSCNRDHSGTYGHECKMKFTGCCPCACMHVCAIMRCDV